MEEPEVSEEPEDPGVSGEPADGTPEEPGADPDRFTRVRRSAAGVMLTGIALGLQEVFEPKREEPAIVVVTSGDPDGPPGPIDLHFDPDDPKKTVAVVRRPPEEPPAPS